MRRARRTVAVRGDELPETSLEQRPAEFLGFGPVPAEERGRIDLQRPASSGQLLRDEGIGEHDFRSLRMRDHRSQARSEEHTSELQSQSNLVCRLLLEKKKTQEY